MNQNYKSEQELFWAGDFGNSYNERNTGSKLHASNLHFFSNILKTIPRLPKEVFEIGGNIGMNINALKLLLPQSTFTSIEINGLACDELEKTGCEVIRGSIIDLEILDTFDLVFTKGVLIHINPEQLANVYEKIYETSRQYILVAEYFNPTPVSIEYRGHSDKLFKRDFAKDLMDLYTDLQLISYGFAYSSDQFPQDNISWFLLEKISQK
jgi:pseudaminic acid biosynthesis-associated methylase